MNKKEFLLNLFKDCDFDDFHKENVEKKVILNLPEDYKYRFFYGITKLCIIPEDSLYVLKIPFKGTIDCYDDEYYDFVGAGGGVFEWDYCAFESFISKKADEEKVGFFFAKEELLGYVNDHPIYIQKRAQSFADLKGDPDCMEDTSESVKASIKYCKKKRCECFNAYWIADAFEYYGEEKVEALFDFLKKYEIDDLHNENIGYVGDRPIIFDYSSFLG